MSREQYTPPSLSQPSQQPGGSGTAGASSGGYGGFNITGAGNFEDTSRPVHYLCGDCDSKVVLRKSDPIRCKECGYRVLYKERTNRMIQFEAR
ncbi:DNA-directed RNA polymerase core subunit rpc10 [Elasticomyces elasticus]|nr:DNA-directed RNA polymerase core subunit rpc10 [Elasticomyces elasticus]KAK3632802.1 DNA-directed RNA polymerase core subunit rpc10 [Elasticomyces elasticus]KAK4918320.1 DNA-directed RNA polymerase core subunit rpc10 [Elasticomyces elasticus]KAK5762730.1 DNA-directed RNA polymerase core subunit rpc10 [Elasticomyces elasticus]